MSSSSLRVNWFNGPAALDAIRTVLEKANLAVKAQEAYLEEGYDTRVVTLPGYGIFDASASDGVRALDWAVPRPKHIDDVVLAYEEFVDRPLGREPQPEVAAKRVWRAGPNRKFFGGRRSRWDWWVPAVQLVALAAKRSGESVEVKSHRVTLDLGDALFDVNRRSAWCNSRRVYRSAYREARDADISLLATPNLTTWHRLAQLLTQIDAPPPALWAANAAIRAEALEDMPPITPEFLSPVEPRTMGPRKVYRHPADVLGALSAAREVLMGYGDCSVLDLYQALVPVAARQEDFCSAICNPYNKGYRDITPRIRSRAEEFITTLETSACRAEHAR